MTSINALPPLSVVTGLDKSQKAKATMNAYEKSKALSEELKGAKKFEKESKILKTYGENPETGKRNWGKIIGRTILNSLLVDPILAIAITFHKINKADNIQTKRELAELKGEVEEYRSTKDIRKDQFVVLHAKDPETGKRPLQAYVKGSPVSTFINTKIADKMAAKQATAQQAEVQEIPAEEIVAAEV